MRWQAEAAVRSMASLTASITRIMGWCTSHLEAVEATTQEHHSHHSLACRGRWTTSISIRSMLVALSAKVPSNLFIRLDLEAISKQPMLAAMHNM